MPIFGLKVKFVDSLCPSSVETQQSVVRLKVAGKISSRTYIPPGASVSFAKAQVRLDMLRSLRTRFAMHCESVEQDKEDGVEMEKRLVHEPPRRVFVTMEEEDISVSDYLYP